MKVTAQRSELADAAAWVASAIAKRPVAPALSGMKVTADAERQQVDLSAYSYDVAHTATLDAIVAEDGEALTAGHLVRELLGAMRGKQVDLVGDEQRLTLQAGRSTYRTNLLALDEYPSLPTMPKVVGEASVDELAMLVRSTEHVIDDAAVIPAIRGIRIEATDGTLLAVGLSSPAMSTTASGWDGDEFACQLPVRALEQALRGMSGTVEVGCSENLLGLSDGRQTVTLRTFDGDFAKWRQLMRDESPISAECEIDDLRDAVKRASLTLAEGDPIYLAIKANSIEILAGTGETADGSEVIDATTEGELEIAFGAHILAPTLGAIPSGRVKLGCLTSTKPMTVVPADDSSWHLVMPKRTERTAS